MNAIHKFRAASNGKVFTRTEKLNIIEARKVSEARRASINEIVAIEKNKIAAARAERIKARETAEKVFEFKKENPGAAVSRGKNGQRWFQPRSGGKFLPKVKVA